MDLIWAQVNQWAYNSQKYPEFAQAALSFNLSVQGMKGDEIRARVQKYVSDETSQHGPMAVADLPEDLKETIEVYFTPQARQPAAQRTVAGPSTQAAQAATNQTSPAHAGDMPSFWANPWKYLTFVPPPVDGNDKTGAFKRWSQAHW